MKKQAQKRFENVLGGDEYDLLKQAIPHYDELQARIAHAVSDHFPWIDRHHQKEIKVLEIGPGSGITTKALLKCDPRVIVTAVDNGTKMSKTFKKNIRAWGYSKRVKFIKADINSEIRESASESFDVVASAWVIHNFERSLRPKLIAEIWRVLKPNGIFVNGDKLAQDDMDKRAEAYKRQIKLCDVFDRMGRPDIKKEWLEHYLVDEQPHIVYVESEAVSHLIKACFVPAIAYRQMMEAVLIGYKAP
ncbi:MAG TPA: methyltransferase domain-containing protein [Candidatus Paceibacterota bacterium]|nr:methyltransferase domain-containing protein [Candidatus Paceibacterota bacterium]